MKINYEKFGICVTLAIVVALVGVTAIASGEFGIELAQGDYQIPQITSSTDTSNNNVYSEWCFKMKIDC